jgi:LPS-assembly lipoprotein
MSSSEPLRSAIAAPAAMLRSRVRRSGGLAWIAAALALSLAITGCGFHLRGDVSYPFAAVYVTAPPNASILIELTRAIEGSGSTKVVARPADAPVRLDIVNVNDDKQVLSLSGGGRVREYQLTKRVSFHLHDGEGRSWLPPGEITIRRSYTFNETEVLAREAQETRLLTEMQTDAVQQIVRQLQSAKKPAA